MTLSAPSDVYYDPYDVELNADPYPMFKRLRDEMPLYYNGKHDFYAVSRHADVNAALLDTGTYSSARGAIIELIKAGIEIPRAFSRVVRVAIAEIVASVSSVSAGRGTRANIDGSPRPPAARRRPSAAPHGARRSSSSIRPNRR